MAPDDHNDGKPSYFLNPSMDIDNVDKHVILDAQLRYLKNLLPLFRGVFLDIGCGVMPYKSLVTNAPSSVSRYIGMDMVSNIYKADVDLRWDGRQMPLEDASVDCAMATQVLEHCPEPMILLKEARRVLKPDGLLFLSVPFIWPLHDVPYDFYRYTPFALEKMLAEAGFEILNIKGLGGWNGAFAQMIGLWLKRAPLADKVRVEMARQLWPLYEQLVGSDKEPDNYKYQNCMATGWAGLARVPSQRKRRADMVDDIKKVDGLCIANYHVNVYSETFIDDHIRYLSDSALVLWGNPPLLVNVGGGTTCLEPAEVGMLKAAQNAQQQARITLPAIARYLLSRKVRVVLAEYGPIGVALAPLCEKIGIPLVVHFHGYDASLHKWFENDAAFYRSLFQTARKIIVVSKAMKQRLIAAGAPADKLVLNPYGVDVNQWTPAVAGNNPPMFLAVGRFVEKKRPALTIRAFARMLETVPEATLYMIGDGDLLAECRKLAADLHIEDKVCFTGVQSREMVHVYMSRARAFVQHSAVAANGDSEGLPVGILEAGSMALPVVSTFHAGIPDAVRDGLDGFLVKEGDVEAMSDAMIRLASDPDLATRIGQSFRERICEGYTRRISLGHLAETLLDTIG
ncbi:MAG: glycosyltransferase [Opitutales bacterium]|jgi:glycosyltransferase involved in cell wall biosynthesis